MELLNWMGAHPVLTVILASFICQSLVYIVRFAFGGKCDCDKD